MLYFYCRRFFWESIVSSIVLRPFILLFSVMNINFIVEFTNSRSASCKFPLCLSRLKISSSKLTSLQKPTIFSLATLLHASFLT